MVSHFGLQGHVLPAHAFDFTLESGLIMGQVVDFIFVVFGQFQNGCLFLVIFFGEAIHHPVLHVDYFIESL